MFQMYAKSAFKSTRKTDLVNVKKNIIGILVRNNSIFLYQIVDFR